MRSYYDHLYHHAQIRIYSLCPSWSYKYYPLCSAFLFVLQVFMPPEGFKKRPWKNRQVMPVPQMDLHVTEAEQVADVPDLCSCRNWNISDDVRNWIQYFTKFVERDTDALRTCNRRAKRREDVLTTYCCVLQRSRNVALSLQRRGTVVVRFQWT